MKSPAALADGEHVPRSDVGQAAVELALALPFLCLLLLGVVQIVIVAADQLLVIEAARAGARSAAIAADPVAASASASRRVAGTSARVTTTVHDGYVAVVVTVTNHTDVPIIGALLADVDVVGRTSMILEPP
jgi:Flp pilus assembly protein TadG